MVVVDVLVVFKIVLDLALGTCCLLSVFVVVDFILVGEVVFTDGVVIVELGFVVDVEEPGVVVEEVVVVDIVEIVLSDVVVLVLLVLVVFDVLVDVDDVVVVVVVVVIIVVVLVVVESDTHPI